MHILQYHLLKGLAFLCNSYHAQGCFYVPCEAETPPGYDALANVGLPQL